MTPIPERLKIERCMRCREPVGTLKELLAQGERAQNATLCAQCAPPAHSRPSRIDRLRAAAMAAHSGRARAPLPSPNRSGQRHL